MSSILSPFSILLTLIPLLIPITGQLLTAEYLSVRLPHPDPSPRLWYDGDDTIYLFGGWSDERDSELLKFTISSETLEKVGSLPGGGAKANVQTDNFGNIFYFGDGSEYADVYKFDPIANTTTAVANLPYWVDGCITIKYNESSNTAFILGVWVGTYELWSFDMVTLTTTVLKEFPIWVNAGTAVRLGNKAYIFDNSYPNENKMALEFNLDNYDIQPVGPPTLPDFYWSPSSVWDGNYAYIIGGYMPNTGHPMDGLIRFDPVTKENNFIRVENFLIKGNSFLDHAPASVFVPSKNRMYCFGGRSYNYTVGYETHDEIFYIDLTPLVEPTSSTTDDYTPSSTFEYTFETTFESTFGPTSSTTLNPDFFTCSNRPNGFYPHPSDCSLYIGCQNEELTIFSCSPPLLFDPLRKYCNFPEEVECGTSCIDRPDGPHPHPHDCSLFIMCRSGSSNLFKCPLPLLFNPEMRYCDFPDLVNCSITAGVITGKCMSRSEHPCASTNVIGT